MDYSKFYFNGKHRPYRMDVGKSSHPPIVPTKQPENQPPLTVTFESIHHLVDYVQKQIPPGHWPYCFSHKRPNHYAKKGDPKFLQTGEDRITSQKWSWGYNSNDALALLERGWHEGFDAVKYQMEQAAIAAMTALREVETIQADVAGSYVDVGAFVAGVPENMYEFHTHVQEVLHLDVELDFWIVWDTPADELMYRGVAVMSAIMALRRLGVFVDLYAAAPGECQSMASNGSYTKHNAIMHMMNQHLTENLSEVLMAVAHPAFVRTLFYLAMSTAFGIYTTGMMAASRDVEDFIPKAGSGKVVIPGRYTSDNLTGAREMGLDFESSWASPSVAAGLVKMMFQAAAPKNR